MPIIRPAVLADGSAIAKVHVASWRTTYRGIVPDAVLDDLPLERRERYAHDVLSDPTRQEYIYVAENDGGHIIGIASGGPARDSEPLYRGELYMIYLLQAAQRQGIGRMLIAAVAQRLAQQRLPGMIIWALADNPACQFYEAMGGLYLRDKIATIGGTPLREVAYGWQDTQPLIAR